MEILSEKNVKYERKKKQNKLFSLFFFGFEKEAFSQRGQIANIHEHAYKSVS